MTTWQDVFQPGRAPRFFERQPLPIFNPGAPSYNRANAWWLAELSRLVYRHDIEEDAAPLLPLRSSFLAATGLRQMKFFNERGTQAYLVKSDAPTPFAALVFRGTEGGCIRDVAHDLWAWTVPLTNHPARVHKGFSKALDAVWGEVAKELDRLDPECPIFYAGHSLGAALATLAASRRPPRALYTFGSPRVGNAAFATALNHVPVFRVVDHADVVATLPPELLGYAHVGEIHPLAAPVAAASSSNPLSWLRYLRTPPGPLADHAPINYVERL